MKSIHKHSLSVLTLLSLSQTLFSWEGGDQPPPLSFEVAHIEGKGIGYQTGYTSADFFLALPDSFQHSWVPFADLRGHVFDNGKLAANAGLGLRYVDTRVWGANLFYDYRDTHHRAFNQIGLGLESLGCAWDFRLNAYLPVGRTTSHRYDYQFSGFKGHYALISHKQEIALRGIDAELGSSLAQWQDFSLYCGIGPYYFIGPHKHTVGGKARIDLNAWNYLKLEVSGSYDRLFKGLVQGMLSIQVPFGPGAGCTQQNNIHCCYADNALLHTKSLKPVARQEIIVVDRHRAKSKARDATTGKPLKFWFVDNTSHFAVDGTFEHPFPSLGQVQDASKPNDVLYVYAGDGSDRGMNNGITLQDNQALWGASIDHTIATTNGPFVIPAQGTEMPLITITNIFDAAVILANHNEVSGIHIGNSQFGIFGDTFTDVNINHNLMTISTFLPVTFGFFGGPAQNVFQILLQDASGKIAITDNQLLELPNALVNAGIAIVDITSDNANREILLANNIIHNQRGAVQFGNLRPTHLTVTANTFTAKHFRNQPYFREYQHITISNNDRADLVCEITKNAFVNGGKGIILFTQDQSTANFEISDNTFSGFQPLQSIADGDRHTLFMHTFAQSRLKMTFRDNTSSKTVSAGGVAGVFFDESIIELLVDNNTLFGSSQDSFSGNAISLQVGDDPFTGVQFTGVVTNNETNLPYGYFFIGQSTKECKITFDGNVLSSTQDGIGGISVEHDGPGKLTAIIQNNKLASIGHGARNDPTATGELSVCLSNNTYPGYHVANNSATAVLNLEQHDNSVPAILTGNINQVSSGICPGD